MPQCPKCGTSLKDDYGMVKCGTCESLLFIDMEGNAFIGSEAQEPVEAVASRSPVPNRSSQQAQVQPLTDRYSSNDAVEAEPPLDSPFAFAFDSSAGPTQEESEVSPNAAEEVSFDVNPLVSDTPILNEAGSDEAQEFDANAFMNPDYSVQPLTPASGGERAEQVLGPESDPLGLAAYGNSEVSQGKDGPVLINVLISGIDTKEMRESIREAIEDSRFGWDSGAVMRQINKGTLVLEKLSPVKAVILINRVKRLPVKIRWEQHAITQIDQY